MKIAEYDMSASENSQKTLLDECHLCFELFDVDMAKLHFFALNEQKLPTSCANTTDCSATICCTCYTFLQAAQVRHIKDHHAIRCFLCLDDRGFREMNPIINMELCELLDRERSCEMLDSKKRARRQPPELPPPKTKVQMSSNIRSNASSKALLSNAASSGAHLNKTERRTAILLRRHYPYFKLISIE